MHRGDSVRGKRPAVMEHPAHMTAVGSMIFSQRRLPLRQVTFDLRLIRRVFAQTSLRHILGRLNRRLTVRHTMTIRQAVSYILTMEQPGYGPKPY